MSDSCSAQHFDPEDKEWNHRHEANNAVIYLAH